MCVIFSYVQEFLSDTISLRETMLWIRYGSGPCVEGTACAERPEVAVPWTPQLPECTLSDLPLGS